MLKLGNFAFEDDCQNRRSCLMYDKADDIENSSWSIDIGFAKGKYNGTEISPSICINPIDTDKQTVIELIGTIFSVMSIEESVEREDSFYIFEHEPLVDYILEILEIAGNKAHIKCNGTLIVDGYADPYIKEKFEIDSWIPIIETAEDWKKYRL